MKKTVIALIRRISINRRAAKKRLAKYYFRQGNQAFDYGLIYVTLKCYKKAMSIYPKAQKWYKNPRKSPFNLEYTS